MAKTCNMYSFAEYLHRINQMYTLYEPGEFQSLEIAALPFCERWRWSPWFSAATRSGVKLLRVDSGNRYLFQQPLLYGIELRTYLLSYNRTVFQVFVMYHATRNIRNVAEVLDQGFKISQNQGRNLLLGDGLYVSRDIFKTQEYGEVASILIRQDLHQNIHVQVCFKLLVYPGKAVRVTEMNDPLRTSWQVAFKS